LLGVTAGGRGAGGEAASSALACARPPLCRVQFADAALKGVVQQQQECSNTQQQKQQQESPSPGGLFARSTGMGLQQQQEQRCHQGLGCSDPVLSSSQEEETKAMHMGRFLAGVSPSRGSSYSASTAVPSTSFVSGATGASPEAQYSCSTTLGCTSSPASGVATANSDCAGSSMYWLTPELGLDMEHLHFHRSASNISNSSLGCSLFERLASAGVEGPGGRTESAMSQTSWEVEGTSDVEEEDALAAAVGTHAEQRTMSSLCPAAADAVGADAPALQQFQPQQIGGKGSFSNSSSRGGGSRRRKGLGHSASAAAAAPGQGSRSMPDLSMRGAGSSSSSWGALGSSPPVRGGSCGVRYGSQVMPAAEEENESFGKLVGMELMANAR
jgi:hypothetical protein